jgi:ribosomal protein S18 acetylase RimI-like enzyme
VFHGIADDSPSAWTDMAGLAGADGTVALLRVAPLAEPEGWEVPFTGTGHQFVLTGPMADVPALPATDPTTGASVTMRRLTADDVENMLELVALAEPGPFRPRTIELGGFVGIFHDRQLMAMAGQRFRPPGHCEISAVCTHPDARRRRYASIVTARVAEGIAERGETPFLHVASTNITARSVYEQLGFTMRAVATFRAMRRHG